METIQNLPISAVDIGVVLVLFISGILAYVRGLVHEILSVGAWVGAIFATIFFYPSVQPYARDFIPVELAADLATGIVMFVLTLVILSLATRAVSSRVKESALNILDRTLGFLFGLLRGALIICVAYMGLEYLIPQQEQPAWVTSAKTMPLIQKGARELYALMPDDTSPQSPTTQSDDDATQDILKLIAPEASSPQQPESEGYSEEERSVIDGLIESSQ